jgi:hypothetical protein
VIFRMVNRVAGRIAHHLTCGSASGGSAQISGRRVELLVLPGRDASSKSIPCRPPSYDVTNPGLTCFKE